MSQPATLSLSRAPSGTDVPPAAERAILRWRREDPIIAWTGAIVVTAFAFLCRFVRLGSPHAFSFDETYYAKDAWSMLKYGYVHTYIEDADKSILNGKATGLWTDTPSMVVHPDVGKWLIALGEKAFGMEPFGWRIAAAVVGALSVLVMCRFVRRVSGSTTLGLLGGLLLALDGLHLVLSRLALLDIFLMFFILSGAHCVVADRQWLRARLAARRRVALWRPWLMAGGVSFGLAVGTKWSALFPLAVFGLLAFFWSWGARRLLGQRRAIGTALLVDGPVAFASLVLVALVTYVGSWTGWLMHAADYEEALSNTQYTTYDGGKAWPTAGEDDAEGIGEVTQSLRSLWYYHQDVYAFHAHFLNDSNHVYASKPIGWLLLNRPVGVDAQLDIQPGAQGCEAAAGDTCLRQVLLLGNPLIWWGGTAALLFALVRWVGARDWRFGVAVVGVAATWLPWLMYDDRPIFYFYAIAVLPFLVLGLTLTLGAIVGTSNAVTPRRTAGVIVAGSYVVMAALAFAWFWPLWVDELITHGDWLKRIWFSRWI